MQSEKKTLNVIVISVLFPPKHSGAGLRAYKTYSRMKDKYDINYSVITRDNEVSSYTIYDYDGVKVYRLNAKGGIIRKYRAIRDLINYEKIHDFNIMHCFGSGFFNIAAAMYAKKNSMKLIMELTLNSKNESNGLFERLKELLLYFRLTMIQRFIHRRADLIIAINKILKDYFINIGVKEERIWQRPNPIDTSIFQFPNKIEREHARHILGISDNQYVHLLIGGFNKRKNQLFALQYFSKMPNNHTMVLAGPLYDDKNEYYKLITAYIDTNNIFDRVILKLGFQQDVKLLYHAADVYILPSINEGMPNVMLEALCCGLPILANIELGLDDIVINNENGWNIPLNEDAYISHALKCEALFRYGKARSSIAFNAQQILNADILDEQLYIRLRYLNNTMERRD
jgi:glycosyltransferase involved in cell wall biosynthesis